MAGARKWWTVGVLLVVMLTSVAAPVWARPPKPEPCPPARTAEEATDVPIIWIHGLKGNCDTWKHTLAPTDAPAVYFRYDHAGDFTDRRWLSELDREIGELARQSPTGQVDIVAHSMGGLLSRYYLNHRQMANRQRVRHLFMVGTPNRGSALAYGVRLSDMIADPAFYGLPAEHIRRGRDLYAQYRRDTMLRLFRRRPSFQEWLNTNTNEWELISRLSNPITRRWQRENEAGEVYPSRGTVAAAPYTEGFERLAALLTGAYRAVIPWLGDLPPVDPIESPTIRISMALAVPPPRSMAFDRLLPEQIRLTVAVDRWGNQTIKEVPANPVLLELNGPHGARARPGTTAQQLTGVATVATDFWARVLGWGTDWVAGQGVDPTLDVGPGDGIVEVRSVRWGEMAGTDAFYAFDGPFHTDQGADETVREIVAQIRSSRFSLAGVITLGDEPDRGRRVLDPNAPALAASVQQHLVEGAHAFEIRHMGEEQSLPLRVEVANPLYPVRLWLYAESRQRPGDFDVQEIIAPETLTHFDFQRYSRYVIVMRESTPLTITYQYGADAAAVAAATPENPVGHVAQSGPVLTGTAGSVMLFDVSGSMKNGFQATTKIEAARRVAQQMAAMHAFRADGEQASDIAPGLIIFNDAATLAVPPNGLVSLLQTQISGLSAGGGTNIGAAIEMGLQALADNGYSGGELLLLTDGLPQTGMRAAEILAQLAPRARSAGVTIHTIGFGERSDVDEPFLTTLAAATGGQYTFAMTPFELENQAVNTYHLSRGDPIGSFAGSIGEGETQLVTVLPVHEGVQTLELTLNWPGSRVDLLLTDPQGRVVDAGYPGAAWSALERPRHVTIQAPAAGPWRVQVTGSELPHGPEPYLLQVSGTAAAIQGQRTPFVVGFLFVLAVSCLTFGLAGQMAPTSRLAPARPLNE